MIMATDKEIEELFTPHNLSLLPWETQKKWYRKEKERWEAIEKHVKEVREKYPNSGDYYENLCRERKQQMGAMLVVIREALIKKALKDTSPAYHPAQTTID